MRTDDPVQPRATLPPRPRDAAVGLLRLTTSTLWLVTLGVGLAGLFIRYPTPIPPPKIEPPVQAKLLNVHIAEQPTPAAESRENSTPRPTESPPPPPQPAATPKPLAVAAAPAMTALATPLPVPVEPKPSFPARANVPAQAKPQAVAPPTISTATPPAPQALTFGEGQGDQPAPEYPREAALAHQQGTVVVRLVVGQGGRVLKADAVEACPYPLLNQAAVRAVRERWSRPPAPKISPGTWDVSIEFQLRQR
jgi:protein TonB